MWKRGCASSKRIMQQNLENSSLNWHHKNLNNGIKTDSNMSQNSDCHTVSSIEKRLPVSEAAELINEQLTVH